MAVQGASNRAQVTHARRLSELALLAAWLTLEA